MDDPNPEDVAEEARDPIEELLAAVALDPGAAFKPPALDLLASLKRKDRSGYEAVRQKLKALGVRVLELEKLLRGAEGDGDGGGDLSQVEILLLLAEQAELFHDPAESAYADIQVNDHRETWPIQSSGFRRWLRHGYFKREKGAPSRESEQAAINALEAMAVHAGPKRGVSRRVGRHEGKLYLDLGDDRWQAIEIDASGWRVVADPPTRFIRSAGTRPLPVPVTGGSLNDLRPFLNVKREDDFVLAVAWLLAAFRDTGPFAILAVLGEHGSAKSTFCRLLRALIDPSASMLRTLPDNEDDLLVAAMRSHAMVFDNVSTIPAWLSDALCRIATGGGLSKRQLYSNDEEVLLEAQRPLILNGITPFVERADLADRAVFVELAAIADTKRKTEGALWSAFEAARPRVLGALLDHVALGLKRLPTTKLARLPRMADFALWATACLGERFTEVYDANRREANETVLGADIIASAIIAFMARRAGWTATASDLLQELTAAVGDGAARSRDWPKRSSALSGQIKRCTPALRKVGINVTHDRVASARIIVISNGARARGGPQSTGKHRHWRHHRHLPMKSMTWR